MKTLNALWVAFAENVKLSNTPKPLTADAKIIFYSGAWSAILAASMANEDTDNTNVKRNLIAMAEEINTYVKSISHTDSN